MQSPDWVDENIKKIGELFPDCLTERKNDDGKVELAIDFDKLKQELSKDIVSGETERYQFTWPDKRKAIVLANSPINKTLRPDRDKSLHFDDTENLYIEGDNLDVVKLLRENYLHSIKMMYFDPPYNTGSDFVYKDKFEKASSDYEANSGQTDEEGNILVTNKESNGRFHTDWLNMIYPRLKVARDLLTEDGVIAISIDDNEQENLKKICDEIFGESNFIAQVVWERAYAPINLMKHFSVSHDYVIFYAKNKEKAVCNGIPRSEEANNRYSNPDNDPRGVWKSSDMSVGPAVESNIYTITTPSGRKVNPPSGRSWRVSKEGYLERLKDNRIWFGPNGDGVPSIKRFLSELRKTGITPMTIWKYEDVGHSQGATQELAKLFDGKKYFDYPKPVELIKRCLSLYTDNDSIVLDIFSGSATTAQATMELNATDGGNRKYILVQYPELINKKNPAFEDGYHTICDIGEERIRRAGKKIIEDLKTREPDLFDKGERQLPDVGFRVLKVDSSNMNDVFYSPKEYTGDLFANVEDNIKPDRTSEDLLFQVMLETDIPLSAKVEKETINGKEFFNVGDGVMYASFDKDLTDESIIEVAKRKPLYFIMRNSSAASDSVITNFDTIFKTYSKETVRKIL